jgi:predicted transcriptional regulator
MVSFTPGELEVMQVLWDHGPLNPIQMQERFPRPIHNATLRSVLVVLLKKGHVERHKVGRSYVYQARTPRQNTFQKMVRRIGEIFCGGSPTTLIAQIIKSEKLSKDDILELQRIIGQEAEEQIAEQVTGNPPRQKGKRP